MHFVWHNYTTFIFKPRWLKYSTNFLNIFPAFSLMAADSSERPIMELPIKTSNVCTEIIESKTKNSVHSAA